MRRSCSTWPILAFWVLHVRQVYWGVLSDTTSLDRATTRLPTSTSDHLLVRSADYLTESNESSPEPGLPPGQARSFDNSFTQKVAPNSYLEVSHTFRPETYTTRSGVPTFIQTYSCEIAASEYTRMHRRAPPFGRHARGTAPLQ